MRKCAIWSVPTVLILLCACQRVADPIPTRSTGERERTDKAAEAQHATAAARGNLPGRLMAVGLDVHPHGLRAEGHLHPVFHAQPSVPMSASSPSPPGRPSLPNDTIS